MIYVPFFAGLDFKNQKMSGVTIIFLVQCQILNVSEIFNFCCSSEFNSSFERFLGELYGSLPNSAIQSEFIENEGFSIDPCFGPHTGRFAHVPSTYTSRVESGHLDRYWILRRCQIFLGSFFSEERNLKSGERESRG
jgi:hypothetical protein